MLPLLAALLLGPEGTSTAPAAREVAAREATQAVEAERPPFFGVCVAMLGEARCEALLLLASAEDSQAGGSVREGDSRYPVAPDVSVSWRHPWPHACSLDPRPTFSWKTSGHPDAACARIWLEDARGETVSLQCPDVPPSASRGAATPEADLAPGYWTLHLALRSGRPVPPVPFAVGPVGALDARPCSPAEDEALPVCPEGMSPADLRRCEALRLYRQGRYWELDALLHGDESSDDDDALYTRMWREAQAQR